MRVRSLALGPRKVRVGGGPAWMDPLGQVGKGAGPVLDDSAVRLEMELGAIGGTADTKGLMCGSRTLRKVDGTLGQGEGVGVPLENREGVGKAAKHRVGAACLGKADVDPAELGRGAEVVIGPIGASQKLRPKADAKNGFTGGVVGGHQVGESWQIGVGVIVGGGLLAAKDHKGIGVIGRGKRVVGPGFPKVYQRSLFVKCHADLTVVRDPGVLDDGDAHGVSFALRA